MKSKHKVELIMNTLNLLYPNPEIPLQHTNNFTLLVAVVLSAQSTDKKVNEITTKLFKKASKPFSMYKLGEKNSHIFARFFRFLRKTRKKALNCC